MIKKSISRWLYATLASTAHDTNYIFRKARTMRESNIPDKDIVDFVLKESSDLKARNEVTKEKWFIIEKFVDNNDLQGFLDYHRSLGEVSPMLESILTQNFYNYVNGI